MVGLWRGRRGRGGVLRLRYDRVRMRDVGCCLRGRWGRSRGFGGALGGIGECALRGGCRRCGLRGGGGGWDQSYEVVLVLILVVCLSIASFVEEVVAGRGGVEEVVEVGNGLFVIGIRDRSYIVQAYFFNGRLIYSVVPRPQIPASQSC